MEISNGWSLSFVDTGPLNITMSNLMQPVLLSSGGIKSGNRVYMQKYGWLLLMGGIRSRRSLKEKKKKVGAAAWVGTPKICAGLEN